MKRLLLATAIAGLVLLAIIQPASAHVLITDEGQVKGAILHIIPDDDPIAGQKATLYFDAQDNLLQSKASQASLTISNHLGEASKVKTKIDKTLVMADYTFPEQGVYQLSYQIKTGGKTYSFNHSQRISRGVAGSALDKPTHTWAEMAVIVAGIGLVLLAIIVFNRRQDIAAQSKF